MDEALAQLHPLQSSKVPESSASKEAEGDAPCASDSMGAEADVGDIGGLPPNLLPESCMLVSFRPMEFYP